MSRIPEMLMRAVAAVAEHRTLVGGLLLLGTLAAPSVAGAQQRTKPGLAIAAVPAIVNLTGGDAGQSAYVELRNEGGLQAQMRVYLGDFEQNLDGGFSFVEYGQGSHSCGRKLTVFPDGAVLGPGERQTVQLRLAPGSGVCWAVLFIESMPQGRGPVKVVQRIGVKVLNVPAGTRASGAVTGVEAQRLAGDSLRVRTLFQNDGASPLELKGRIEVRDYSGRVYAQSDFGPFGSLPGRGRLLDVTFPARLPAGDYVAVPIVDFGGDYLAGGQTAVRVP